MRLLNYTKVPDDLLREMVRFCNAELHAHGFDITFKNSGNGTLHGRAYTLGTDYHLRDTDRGCKRVPLVVITVPKWYSADPVPYCSKKYWQSGHIGNLRHWRSRKRQASRGYMLNECWSHHEELVHIVAHELRHLWQRRVKTGRRVWGARGQMSERDADAYGIHATRMWRRR